MEKCTHVRDNRAFFKDDEERTSERPLSRIYCGAVPGNHPHPAYYLIIGEHRDPDSKHKRPLFFLAEEESQSQQDFFQKVTDDIRRLGCTVVFTDQAQEGFWEALFKARTGTGAGLRFAPYVAEIEHGKTLIGEAKNTKHLDIPDTTIIGKQVRDLTGLDQLKDPAFYAVTALRFVLGGFQRYEHTSLETARKVINVDYPW
jgi:hypothetical protein